MPVAKKSVNPRKADRLKVVAAVKGPVAYMHGADVGKLVARGSKRVGCRLTPNYATLEDGVDTVKVLMATDSVISFEAFRPKGAIDTRHQHPDHHSVVYQKQGRVKMRIGEKTYIVEAGDSYIHPMGVVHQHEALEDSVRIETKVYPGGGAIASWNALVGNPVGKPVSGAAQRRAAVRQKPAAQE